MLDFGETYLYKVQALSNVLNKVFDEVLRRYGDITLSQFMILAVVSRHSGMNQRQIAQYLQLSAVAVKRQADIAKSRAWIEAAGQRIRGEALQLTPEGERVLEASLRILEEHVLTIFDGHNRSLNLMQHLDLLLKSAKEVRMDGDQVNASR